MVMRKADPKLLSVAPTGALMYVPELREPDSLEPSPTALPNPTHGNY